MIRGGAPRSSELHCLDVAVSKNTQEFADLEEEWEDLCHNSPLATPFQSWAWLYSWWEHYGKSYELRLVTLRDGEGLLVGLVPLMLERRWGFGRLLFVGTPQTDYQDVLAREGWEDRVADAARHAINALDGWQVADLQQLRSEAVAWGIFQRWNGPRARIWQEDCPVMKVKPWSELIASFSKSFRKDARRAIRRIEADGVSRRQVGPEDAEQAAHRLVALHRELWRDRSIINPEHLTRRWGSFIEDAFCRMMACGRAGISEFRRDGEVLISLAWVFSQDSIGVYHSGATQEALRRYQWSSLLVWEGLNIARDRNSAWLDFLRGKEPYKLRWTSKVVSNYRVILSRNLLAWTPYAAFHVLRSRARRYADSDSAPKWIKGTVYPLAKRVRSKIIQRAQPHRKSL